MPLSGVLKYRPPYSYHLGTGSRERILLAGTLLPRKGAGELLSSCFEVGFRSFHSSSLASVRKAARHRHARSKNLKHSILSIRASLQTRYMSTGSAFYPEQRVLVEEHDVLRWLQVGGPSLNSTPATRSAAALAFSSVSENKLRLL